MDDKPWGIWIDVEGFSNLWSAGDLALRGLNRLTSMIFAIGQHCYPSEPDRLFAHQIGDGFYISSDFHEPCLDRCVAIAIVLMRGMTEIGSVARAAIAEGALADYSGTRPKEIRIEIDRTADSDVISLGAGIMTLQAVMGQGIINAVTLDKLTNTKGAILTIGNDAISRLSSVFPCRPLDEAPAIVGIDWVHATSPLIDEIATKAAIPNATPGLLEDRLRDYTIKHGLSAKWSAPTFKFAGM